MSPPPPAATVLAYLTTGRRTVADVERMTGWPAHAIRTLIARQKGWLIGRDGRVVIPKRRDAPVLHVQMDEEPRPAEVLYAELAARKAELELSWRDVISQMRSSKKTIDNLRHGLTSERTRERVEAWLAHTAPTPQEERPSA